ncbi:MAG: autotransporter outer membrane beta-barrel domain-containing protein [Campylobacteraceae bacterium]|nr:autotransporter outer membrane beta-barrel domain-containing protein [Campylobacteraceae bacterium]
MLKTYLNGYNDGKRFVRFFHILTFIGLAFAANLSADCTNLGSGHVECDEMVNSNVYANASNGVSSSSLLDVSVTGNNVYGVHNNGNGTWNFDGLNAVTNGDNAHAVYGQNGANIIIDGNAHLTTNGTNSYGVYAIGNSNINIGDNAQISTYGPDAPPTSTAHGVLVPKSASYGIMTSNSSVTIGDNAIITTAGIGSTGVYVTEDSLLVIGDNVTIATTGGDPYCGPCGIVPATGYMASALSVGSTNTDTSRVIIGNNANISTQGAIAYAVSLGRRNVSVDIGDNATITANGDRNTNAINLATGGNLTIGANAVITGYGDMIYYDDSRYNGQPHTITGGQSAIFVLGDNATIASYGKYAHAVQFNDALVIIGDNARITTYGEGRYTGASSTNEGGFGIKIRNGYATEGPDRIEVGKNAIITTYGNQAVGIQIRELSTGIFDDNLSVITHGNNANALETYDRSNVTVGDNALITTFGNASHAVHTLTHTSVGNTTTIIGKSASLSTQGDGSHAVFVEGRDANTGAKVILNTDTNISALGTGSYAIYSANTNGLVLTNGTAKMNILGDVTAVNGGVIDLNLNDGSTFFGNAMIGSSADTINLAFDGSNSLWRLKGNSSLTNLILTNKAKVDLTKGASYSNLIIDNLAGEGVFYQRINLNGDGDLITINNSSSGEHQLILDSSALGGVTLNGNESFLLVEQNSPGGVYNATFTGEAYIGAYVYNLYDSYGNQYLATSAFNGTNGTQINPPVINPIAQASVSFANINYISNYANTQTLLQRIGELDANRDTLDDIWVRTYAGELDSFDKKFDVKDAGYYGLQVGFDRIYDIGDAKGFVGLTFGVSKTDINYKQGDGEVNSYDFGLYASYKNNNDFYVDTLLKYTKNKNEFSISTPNGATITGDGDTDAYSLSIESGKKFDVGNNFYLEPQAEFTFTKQPKVASAASSGLKTKFDGYESILGRVGTIFGYSVKGKTNVYYKIGYIKEFDGDISYSFNNEETKRELKLNGDIFDNAIGVTSTIDGDHHIYFEGTYQIGDSFNNKKANLGYKYSF